MDYAAVRAGKIAAIVPVCEASSPHGLKAKNIAHANLPLCKFQYAGYNYHTLLYI
jgi:hypothetical protein